MWRYRRRLAVGLGLMLVNRLAGLVLPGTSKFLIDEVIVNSRADLLATLAIAAGVATVVQAGTSFSLARLLGVAAQRAIMEMRKVVQEHVTRLPVAYFDSTKTGVLKRLRNRHQPTAASPARIAATAVHPGEDADATTPGGSNRPLPSTST